MGLHTPGRGKICPPPLPVVVRCRLRAPLPRASRVGEWVAFKTFDSHTNASIPRPAISTHKPPQPEMVNSRESRTKYSVIWTIFFRSIVRAHPFLENLTFTFLSSRLYTYLIPWIVESLASRIQAVQKIHSCFVACDLLYAVISINAYYFESAPSHLELTSRWH